MLNNIWISLAGILTAVMAFFVSYIYGKNKGRAEETAATDKSILENTLENLEIKKNEIKNVSDADVYISKLPDTE